MLEDILVLDRTISVNNKTLYQVILNEISEFYSKLKKEYKIGFSYSHVKYF